MRSNSVHGGTRPLNKILTWLHLSDIHYGHGGASDLAHQVLVLNGLKEDLLHLRDIPIPEFIFVTGDIATRGGAAVHEYKDATTFLSDICAQLNIEHSSVYVVPGNHDVDRGLDKTASVRRLTYSLRDKRENIDEIIGSDEASVLLKRQHAFWTFAEQFHAKNRDMLVDDTGLYWRAERQINGICLVIVGLNTSLLAADNDDFGKLLVGLQQLNWAFKTKGNEDIVLVMSHHPASWLSDSVIFSTFIDKHAVVHLFGHVHDAEIAAHRRAGFNRRVTSLAGAVHEAPYKASSNDVVKPRTSRYSIGQLGWSESNALTCRVWTRIWSERNHRFEADNELSDVGKPYFEETLERYSSLTTNGRTRNTISSRVSLSTLRKKLGRVAGEMLQTYGKRRTAYPSDLTLAELYSSRVFVPTRILHMSRQTTNLTHTLTEVVSDILAPRNILLLGDPGAGKSFAIFEFAQLLHQSNLIPFIFRISDLHDRRQDSPDICHAICGLSINKKLTEILPGAVILIDGVDEALDFGLSVSSIASAIRWATENAPCVITCRRREFEDFLFNITAGCSIDAVYRVAAWRCEDEFTTFVEQLLGAGMLETSVDLLKLVRGSEALRNLVARPLFARMLTLIPTNELRDDLSIFELYSMYFARLSSTARVELERRGHKLINSPQTIWAAFAWSAFSQGLVKENKIYLPRVMPALTRFGSTACVEGVLAQIVDLEPAVSLPKVRFVHFSFFEYLVANHVATNLLALQERESDLARLLSVDLTPEMRHFLVSSLEDPYDPELDDILERVYLAAHSSGFAPRERRIICNLVVYVISRAAHNRVDILSRLQGVETDSFLVDALDWGLCHAGQPGSSDRAINRLESSSEARAGARGYVLYYYGDIDRKSDPPYLDLTPTTVSWDNTRRQVIGLMSKPMYVTVSPHRRALDLFTFLDIAAARSAKLTAEESQICLRSLYALNSTEVSKRTTMFIMALYSFCAAESV